MNAVFFLRHFNDIDHIAPVIWHCLRKDDEITAVMLNLAYDIDSDPRLQLLREYSNFDLETVDEFLDLNIGKSLFTLEGRSPEGTIPSKLRRVLQITNLMHRWAVPALREVNPDICVFEWGPPSRASHAEFFSAADRLNIPTVCLPHGLNIYLNEDIKPGRKEAFEEGRKTMNEWNKYDAYVTQSHHDKEQEGKLGVDPEIHYVLGSARYYPEWQSINEGLYDAYDPSGDTDGKTVVVIMLPHWDYYVDKETTLQLISTLSNKDWLYPIIKEHTRGDSLPTELDAQLVKKDNAEIKAETPSVSLIKTADAVINFGSSIGIEALLQDKYHINPSYLHSNTTIFDETGAGYRPNSNDEVVSVLKEIHNGRVDPIPEASKRELYRLVVYGGREEHDVLAAYRSFLETMSQT